ncbi:hypothetical protein [Clostridium botulinum]|uniref:hypothetical protein n=1 Tax=Clostridium botulinum TaxID=1491 RepID=UPI000ABCB6DC|nr:hypothetical protein [Clostridium botulinum]
MDSGYMKIGDLIKSALKDIELPIYFIKRENETEECIVYNYLETPNSYGDMKEVSTKYTVLLNVYSISKVEYTKEKIKKYMLKAGFKKIVIPKTVESQNGIYNTAMQFKIGVINQD